MPRPSVLLPILAVCASLGGACALQPAPAGQIAATRGPGIPVPVVVQEARRYLRNQDRAGALAVLEEARGFCVDEPERSWLLAMLWRLQCGRARGRKAAQALPASDLATALRAVTSEDPRRALGRVLGQRSLGEPAWRQLAQAHLLARMGNHPGTAAAARRALCSARAFVRQEALLLQGRALLEEGGLAEAETAARAAQALDALDTRPLRLRAEIERRRGDPDAAVLLLVESLRAAPGSERAARRLVDLLRADVAESTWRTLGTCLDAVAADEGAGLSNPELLGLYAMAREHQGRAAEAIVLYQRALRGGAIALPFDRRLRRLLFARGRYREAVVLLERAVPPDVLRDPENLLRPRWEALAQAAGSAPDATADPAARLALARALVGVGALQEVLHVLAGVAVPGAEGLAVRVQGHLAFERALEERLEAGYRSSMRKEDPPDFDRILGVLTQLARRHLVPEDRAAFLSPERGRRSVPLLGTWLDHSTDTRSPVVAHFRKYGRFLMFGQRGSTPPEAIVLSLAGLARAQRIRTAGRWVQHDVAVGYDRSLRAFVAAKGGALGGACLPDGLWMDADASRRADHELRRSLSRDPARLAAVQASGALAPDTCDGVYALSDPGCTAARLALRYIHRHPRRPWGSFGTLRAHEASHVADLRRHLPILKKLPATVALFVGSGFSADGVEMELERRAQLGACIDAPDPDLALSEMLLALPLEERHPEVHEGGYRKGVRGLVLHIASHPELYPTVDPSLRIVTQLDRLTNDQIRRAARAALGR